MEQKRDLALHLSTLTVSVSRLPAKILMAEATFLKSLIGIIANQPISYPEDFRAPPEQSLRRIPVVPVCFLTPWRQKTSVLPMSFILW